MCANRVLSGGVGHVWYGVDVPRDKLAACVRKAIPGAANVDLRPICTGKFNTSYFVRADDQALVLRIAPPADTVFCFYERGMMRQEPGLHRLLRAKTTVPVPEILCFDDSHQLIDRDYLVMRRLPGRPLSEVAASEGTVFQAVGQALAQVHQLTADAYGYLGEHHCMEPQPTWAKAFAVMWRRLLDDIVRGHYYTAKEADGLERLLAPHLKLFDRHTPPRLLHMDVWAENILVESGDRLSGLLDWDRALWGDPEIEFAVLDYCGVSTPAFWRGYGQPRDDSREAKTRRAFYLLYEVQKYIVICGGREHDAAGAHCYKRQTVRLIQESFGKGAASCLTAN